MEMQASQLIAPILSRNLIFVHGKGGVGKTVISKAVALRLSKKGKKTLWATFEDPTLPAGEVTQEGPHLWHLNCDFTQAFQEYASMKIGIARLTQLFLKNKLMRYLAQAAPGIHELVLLGKIWFERLHYDHVVIDMPSTGYGLAMFQSAENFSKLFHSGPLHRDADAMLGTFNDSKCTGHLIVAIPEETPLRESLELNQMLDQIFPKNPCVFLANRLFPGKASPNPSQTQETPDSWPSPLASSTLDYARKRYLLENYNLRLWREAGITFGELGYIAPAITHSTAAIIESLGEKLHLGEYL